MPSWLNWEPMSAIIGSAATLCDSRGIFLCGTQARQKRYAHSKSFLLRTRLLSAIAANHSAIPAVK